MNGDLYTVSDKHDYTIFRIEIKEEVAILKPHIQIIMPETLKVNLPLDFEGITNDDAGNFFIISETLFRILRISSNGKDVSWISPDLKPFGKQKKLFQD